MRLLQLPIARASVLQCRCTHASHTARLAFSTTRTHRAAAPEQLLERAHLALSRQDYGQARDLFETITKQPGASLDSYYNLGVVEWLQKRPDQAVRHWHTAIDQHAKDSTSSRKLSEEEKETLSSCNTNLANYYLLFKPDLPQALSHLKAATELRPADGEVRYNYAIALERNDEIELALENYLRAEELGVRKNIDQLIRNAGAKLVKRNADLPPSPQEMFDEAKAKSGADSGQHTDDVEPMGTIVDRGVRGDGR